MLNPFSNVDLVVIPKNDIQTSSWFNPDSVEVVDVALVSTDIDNTLNQLFEEFVKWDVIVDDVANDNVPDDVLYQMAPSQIHCSDEYVKAGRTDSETNIDDEEGFCEVVKHFSYALTDDSKKVLGVITGSFSISGDYEINTRDKHSKDMWITCEVDTVEIAPEYRSKGLGTTMAEMLVEAGSNVVISILDTIPKADLKKLSFTPRVSSELHSQSGYRWFESITAYWEGNVQTLLEHYVPASKINDVQYDAGL